jgi:hypothetical protein
METFSFSQANTTNTKTARTGRRSGEHIRSIARGVYVLFHDIGYGSIRIGAANDGNRAAAAPARDPGAVETLRRAGRSHHIHDEIGSTGAETACRVTCVRLEHQFTKAPKFNLPTPAQQ